MSDNSRPATRPKNSFEYVTIASARARQLLQGCVPRVDGSAKPARRALQEVQAGSIEKANPAPSPEG